MTSQEEFLAMASTTRAFAGLVLAPPLSLDELDLSECRFDRCLFRLPAIRSADFSEAEFKDCKFEPTRLANCKLAKARLDSCVLFDSSHKKGCVFAFCDLQAAEMAKVQGRVPGSGVGSWG